MDKCHLVPDLVNDLLTRALRTIESGPFRSVAGVEVRTSRSNGQSIIILDLESGAEAAGLAGELAGLKREFSLAGAVASIFDGKNRRDEKLFGRDFIEENIRGLTFRIGARSYFQTNAGILEKVFDDVAAAAAPWAEETVADLYCGLGTFGILLAKKAREVFGVESAPENIALLKKNLALNRVGHFAVCEGTTEEWIAEVLERSPGVVVLDPPRKGVEPAVVRSLEEDPVPLLLYLSCNPATTSPSWKVTEQKDDRLKLAAGELALELNIRSFHLQILRDGRIVLATRTPPSWLTDASGDAPISVRMAFESPAVESFHGLGERFNAFNLRGSSLDASVYEQYKNQGVHTYIPVPFFLSSQGYGFYVETARFSSFDFAASDPDR